MGIVMALTNLPAEEPSLAFVCGLGIAVVFIGLICIIGIVVLMNMVCRGFSKIQSAPAEASPAATSTPVSAAPVAAPAPIENRQEIIAAVCAAVAEENGTDISAIRVISFKKL
jgi:sodium pump decarboxylase gamma subunit